MWGMDKIKLHYIHVSSFQIKKSNFKRKQRTDFFFFLTSVSSNLCQEFSLS